jgi:hypothetical protein
VFPWVKGFTEQYGVPRLSFLEAFRPAQYLQLAADGYRGRVAAKGPLVAVHLRTFEESIAYQTKDVEERRRRAKKHCSEVMSSHRH